MNFVNFWMRDIVLPLGATACPLDLPDGEYRLVISNGLGPQATAWEVVGAVVVGGAATLTREMEGTADQDWPAGSVIYSSVTAGILQNLAESGGDTVLEYMQEDAEFLFFGEPAASPVRVGQICRQLEPGGAMCEWVASGIAGEALNWRRAVMPTRAWGNVLPDGATVELLTTDRAYAAQRAGNAGAPAFTNILLPDLSGGELLHSPLPLVLANWSAHGWTLTLDPAAFWQPSGEVELLTIGFAALGIAASADVDGVISVVLPADTRVWLDVSLSAETSGDGFVMRCQLSASALNFYMN